MAYHIIIEASSLPDDTVHALSQLCYRLLSKLRVNVAAEMLQIRLIIWFSYVISVFNHFIL